jgi:hypothetical protein
VIRANSFPGLRPKSPVKTYTDVEQFVDPSPQAPAFERALTEAGFVSAAAQFFVPRKRPGHGAEGISTAIQLGSPDGANAITDLAVRQARKQRKMRWRRFTVEGVPGSVGVRSLVRGFGVTNLWFTDGTTFYGLGRTGPRSPRTREVVQAARDLYSQVRGREICG